MCTYRWILSSAYLLVLVAETLVAIEVTDPRIIRIVPAPNWALANAKESDITYTLFRNASDKTGLIVTAQTVKTAPINRNQETIFITHGFTADTTDPWFPEMRDNFFKIGEYNIIFIDWRKPANETFLVAFANVRPVSEFVGKFLLASEISLEKLHLIGHSLGGQLVGYIGKYMMRNTKRQVARITGLDPAAPAFEYPPMMTNKNRLYKTDARFVDIVHTNIKLYGYVEPIGHVDFYPNYGEHQPGCPEDVSGNLHCSHARAPYYFAESVIKKVRAVTCTFKRNPFGTKYDVTVVPDEDGPTVIFGQHVNQTKRGSYYLKTNKQEPFLPDNSF